MLRGITHSDTKGYKAHMGGEGGLGCELGQGWWQSNGARRPRAWHIEWQLNKCKCGPHIISSWQLAAGVHRGQRSTKETPPELWRF